MKPATTKPAGAGHAFTKRGRAWAVTDPLGELVALVLYRKGAAEVVRRLDLAGWCHCRAAFGAFRDTGQAATAVGALVRLACGQRVHINGTEAEARALAAAVQALHDAEGLQQGGRAS